jgi:hypothetical protein
VSVTDVVTLHVELPAEAYTALAALARSQYREPEAQAAWLVATSLDQAARVAVTRLHHENRDQAAEKLAERLRVLHLDAGRPPTRRIAREIGYSHTTAAEALRGGRATSWAVVSALVTYLGGEPEDYRAGWAATR